MIFHDVEQGSSFWFDLRKGVPTASRFHKILTPRTMKPSAQMEELICELVGERYSMVPPERVENYTTRAMTWGIECEAEARHWYQMERGVTVTNGGFCLTDDGRFGASPDALCGEDGALELKCPSATTQTRYLLNGALPDEYRCQVNGHLIVTGRAWVDFCSYCPGLPTLLVRVTPDDFTRELRIGLEVFWGRFSAALAKIQKM